MADIKAWNPWHGCRKYSEGCKHCYMYYLDEARGVPEKSSIISVTSDFDRPLKRNKDGEYKIPPGYELRVNMTSDTFLEEADPWRDKMWKIIRLRPDVRFYILTKRAYRIESCLPKDWNDGYENVELHITCENQEAFDTRWPILKNIKAKHKGMNLSPLIGPIDITPALESGQIEMVNLAGEGYGSNRPCDYKWIKDISDACKKYKVNFQVDSLGCVFIKNGKTYNIKSNSKQIEQAFFSGLSYFDHEIEYKLYSPFDGHLLAKDELMVRHYNKDKCYKCPGFETCVGCLNCGNCKNVTLISYDDVIDIRRHNFIIKEKLNIK